MKKNNMHKCKTQETIGKITAAQCTQTYYKSKRLE